MTKNEFIKSLKERGRVDFGGSILTAPTRELLNPIIESLGLALPDGEIVTHGVQLGTPKGDPGGWKGTLIWVLSLRSHLLVLTADVKYEGTKQRRVGRLHIAHHFHHKNRVKANLRVKCADGTPVFEQADLSLECDGATIEARSGPSLKPDALCRFAASILW